MCGASLKMTPTRPATVACGMGDAGLLFVQRQYSHCACAAMRVRDAVLRAAFSTWFVQMRATERRMVARASRGIAALESEQGEFERLVCTELKRVA